MVPIASVRNDEGSDAAKLLLRRRLVGNAIATVCRSKDPTLQNWKQFEFAKNVHYFLVFSRFFLSYVPLLWRLLHQKERKVRVVGRCACVRVDRKGERELFACHDFGVGLRRGEFHCKGKKEL